MQMTKDELVDALSVIESALIQWPQDEFIVKGCAMLLQLIREKQQS